MARLEMPHPARRPVTSRHANPPRSLLLLAVSICCCLLFTPFLPKVHSIRTLTHVHLYFEVSPARAPLPHLRSAHVHRSRWPLPHPQDKEECHAWKAAGEARGHSALIGALAAGLALATVGYGFVAAVLLLDPQTSCLAFVGGDGCP